MAGWKPALPGGGTRIASRGQRGILGDILAGSWKPGISGRGRSVTIRVCKSVRGCAAEARSDA